MLVHHSELPICIFFFNSMTLCAYIVRLSTIFCCDWNVNLYVVDDAAVKGIRPVAERKGDTDNVLPCIVKPDSNHVRYQSAIVFSKHAVDLSDLLHSPRFRGFNCVRCRFHGKRTCISSGHTPHS